MKSPVYTIFNTSEGWVWKIHNPVIDQESLGKFLTPQDALQSLSSFLDSKKEIVPCPDCNKPLDENFICHNLKCVRNFHG